MITENLALSVVIYTPTDYEYLRLPLYFLAQQTICDQIELIIVHPASYVVKTDEALLNCFGTCVIVAVDRPYIDDGRIRGLRQATTPIVAFLEDHVLVKPDWAEKLIRAYEGGYGAVAATMYPANTETLMSWASFFTSFITWLAPNTSRKMTVMPQHNTTYKRAVLDAYSDDETLYTLMLTEWLLHNDLHERGYKMYLDAENATEHINISKAYPLYLEHFAFLRLFAAQRSEHWSLGKRLVYIVGSPLIPAVRLKSIVTSVRDSKADVWGKLLLTMPIILSLLLFAWVGEVTGYLFGAGKSEMIFSDLETGRLRYITAREREALFSRLPQ